MHLNLQPQFLKEIKTHLLQGNQSFLGSRYFRGEFYGQIWYMKSEAMLLLPRFSLSHIMFLGKHLRKEFI